MSVRHNGTEEKQVIHLAGDIDIGAATDLKASLVGALDAGGEICVSWEAATALDVTAFQLLWAAEREARRAGVKFTHNSTLSEPIRQSLESIGLGELLVGL